MKTEYKFKANQFINTPDHSLKIGEKYSYQEGSFETTVKLLDIKENASSWDLVVQHEVEGKNNEGKLETLEVKIELSFSTEVLGTAYDGNWQLTEL